MARPILLAVSMVLSSLGAGCSDDDTTPGPKSGDSGGPQGWRAAVGDRGVLAQTFDDVSWSSRKVADGDLLAVTCVTNLLGWAVGSAGTIVHTDDGGETWSRQAAGTERTLRTIRTARASASKFIGVVAGDAGALSVSSDGVSWRSVDSGVSASLRGSAIASESGIVLVVGDSATLLRSTDAGATFQKRSIAGAADLTSVAMEPGGLLAIAVDSDGGIWSSADGGESFTLERREPQRLDAVALDENGAHALVAGANGTALARDPHGEWRTLATGAKGSLHAALVTHDASHWYLAGDAGSLVASGDSGKSWSAVNTSTQETLRGLEDLDPH